MDIKKSTSDNFIDLWMSLSHNQQRFAIAMLSCTSKKEAAEMIAVKPNTVYNWNGDIDIVVDYMRNNSAAAALDIVTANATKAAMITTGGLDSDDEGIRQKSATEILDRSMGRPVQRNELTGAEGGPIIVKGYTNVSPDDWPES